MKESTHYTRLLSTSRRHKESCMSEKEAQKIYQFSDSWSVRIDLKQCMKECKKQSVSPKIRVPRAAVAPKPTIVKVVLPIRAVPARVQAIKGKQKFEAQRPASPIGTAAV